MLRNNHTYVIINGYYEGICVEFEQKNKKTLDFLTLLQIASKYYISYY